MMEPTGRLVRDVHARNRRRRRAGGDTKVSWVVWAIVAAGLGLIVTIIIVCVRTMSHPGPGLVAADTVPTGQDVALAVSTFADGRARFYRYVAATGRQETRFFVVQSRDGVIHAALDACDSCFRARRGFRQAGDHLICNACGRAMLSQHVDVMRGECNPVSVEHAVDGDRIVIRAAALEKGTAYF